MTDPDSEHRRLVALGAFVDAETQGLAEAGQRLAAAQHELEGYVGDYLAGRRNSPSAFVDAVPAGQLDEVVMTLIASGTGELRFLRPDQWVLPMGQRIDTAVIEAVGSGRVSRAIYPAAMTSTEPEAVLARVHAGERVRVLPTLTARLTVLGSKAAVLPEVWGSPTSAPLLVRQPSLVAVCTAFFDQLWAVAVAVHGYDEGVDTRTRDQLVHLLARGAKDEHIARSLGVSLRTVRRWIASVLLELGAESRFQAGVEAVRAGWL